MITTLRFPIIYVSLMLMVGWGGLSLGYTADWMQTELPFDLTDSRLQPSREWMRFSLYAGEYRMEVTHHEGPSVARTLMLMPSIVVTAPSQPLKPYLSGGLGLSLSEMAPQDIRMALHLEESVVMQISGGLSYHIRPGIALTSGARFVQFHNAGLVQRFASPTLPLGESGLNFSAYSVQVRLHVTF